MVHFNQVVLKSAQFDLLCIGEEVDNSEHIVIVVYIIVFYLCQEHQLALMENTIVQMLAIDL